MAPVTSLNDDDTSAFAAASRFSFRHSSFNVSSTWGPETSKFNSKMDLRCTYGLVDDNASDVTVGSTPTLIEGIPVYFGFPGTARRNDSTSKTNRHCSQPGVASPRREFPSDPDFRITELPNGPVSTNDEALSELILAQSLRSTHIPIEENIDELFEKTVIRSGKLFDDFFDAEVRTSQEGRQIEVPACQSFSDDFLPPQVRENVERSKYLKLTPVQKYAMPVIACGYDLMACAPTGSGKTAAFLLPIISVLLGKKTYEGTQTARSPLCVILSPTRELATQIYNEARKFTYGTTCTPAIVYGGTKVDYQRSSLNRGAWILVATVGRLLQFVRNRVVCLKKLRYLVFDEADRMLDMGFGADIERLMNNPDINKDQLQTVMFSATFPRLVQELAAAHLRANYVKVTVDNIGIANRCIRQEFVQTSQGKKKNDILELLKEDINACRSTDRHLYEKKTLIFVNTKAFADVLADILTEAGLNTLAIHGDRLQYEREQALHFLREGAIPVLVATSVAGRGLDIRGVDHVINFDLPSEREEYVNRIGRTGRVGNPGRATSFYNRSVDFLSAKWLVDVLHEVKQEPPKFLLRDSGTSSINVTAVEKLTRLTSNHFAVVKVESVVEDDEEW